MKIQLAYPYITPKIPKKRNQIAVKYMVFAFLENTCEKE